MRNIVTDNIKEDDIIEAQRIEDDPQKMLALIDIIFMSQEQSDLPHS